MKEGNWSGGMEGIRMLEYWRDGVLEYNKKTITTTNKDSIKITIKIMN